METWRTVILDSFNNFLRKVLIFLPNLLAMITILILGFLIAWIVKILLFRFLKIIRFDRLSNNWGLTQLLLKGGVSDSPAHLAGRFFYWFIVVITLILGVNDLEVAATQKFIAQFFLYLPNLFAALLIFIGGYLIAVFLGQAALIAAVNAQIDSARLIGRGVRWLILILVFTMALYHLGIAESVVITAFAILFGGIVLTLAIAFGWGGKDLAKDLLEKLYRRRKKEGEGPNDMAHL
jgi:hypothetical protein